MFLFCFRVYQRYYLTIGEEEEKLESVRAQKIQAEDSKRLDDNKTLLDNRISAKRKILKTNISEKTIINHKTSVQSSQDHLNVVHKNNSTKSEALGYPRKNSLVEWEERLVGEKRQISAVDRIIQKKMNEPSVTSGSASEDDVLDLQYQNVHSPNMQLRRQCALTDIEVMGFERKMSPLLTATERRKHRIVQQRPKSLDVARLRRDMVEESDDDVFVSSDGDHLVVPRIEKVHKRRKSKSENQSEDQRFPGNGMPLHQRNGILRIHGEGSSFCPSSLSDVLE